MIWFMFHFWFFIFSPVFCLVTLQILETVYTSRYNTFSLLFSSFFLPFSYSNVIGMLEEETEGTLRKKRLREIRRCWSVFPRELLEQFLRSISHANLPWIYRAITGQTYFCLWSTLIENGGALKYVVSSFLLSFLIFSPSSVASSYSTFYLFVKRISKLRISTL